MEAEYHLSSSRRVPVAHKRRHSHCQRLSILMAHCHPSSRSNDPPPNTAYTSDTVKRLLRKRDCFNGAWALRQQSYGSSQAPNRLLRSERQQVPSSGKVEDDCRALAAGWGSCAATPPRPKPLL
mmetsp:Transcript_131265/g.365846  ORF Transcript_131265/g.365846 Transcript_131265/m.365846 type:complete len:124 (-) Transcript_131265:42-413(-)